MIDYGMFKPKHVVSLSVFLAVSVLILISYYKNQTVTILPSFQTSSMKDLHITHKEADRIKWELSAKEAIFPTGGKEIFLNSIGLNIKQSPEIYLKSGNGTYEIDKGDIMLSASVEMNINSTQFTANSVKWNNASEVLTSDDKVKFSGEHFLVEGTGLSATLKQQKVRILKNVKATFYLS